MRGHELPSRLSLHSNVPLEAIFISSSALHVLSVVSHCSEELHGTVAGR